MRVRVHPRVSARHPEVTSTDVITAVESTLRAVPRAGTGFPPQWVGVGLDGSGRLLEYVAINEGIDQWLVFHAMPATTKALRDVGLRR